MFRNTFVVELLVPIDSRVLLLFGHSVKVTENFAGRLCKGGKTLGK
jgi:hypothetical protein